MNTNQFNNENPFTVPEGYFDTLQERIMNRVRESESERKPNGRVVKFGFYRTMIAAAACVALIFAAALLYRTGTETQPIATESIDDDTFLQWFYTSENAALIAELSDLPATEDSAIDEDDAEDEEIIRFLERDNITVVAIVNAQALYD